MHIGGHCPPLICHTPSRGLAQTKLNQGKPDKLWMHSVCVGSPKLFTRPAMLEIEEEIANRNDQLPMLTKAAMLGKGCKVRVHKRCTPKQHFVSV